MKMKRQNNITQDLRLYYIVLFIIGLCLLTTDRVLACVPAAVPFQWQVNNSDFIGIVEVTGIQERGKEKAPLLKVEVCKPFKSTVDSTNSKKQDVIALLVDFTDNGDGIVHMCNAMWIPNDKRYALGSIYLAFLRRTKQSIENVPIMALTIAPVPGSYLESFRAIKNNVLADFAPLPAVRQFVWTQEYISAIERIVTIENLPKSDKIMTLRKLASSSPKENSAPLAYSGGKATTLSDVAQNWLKELDTMTTRSE